MYVCLVVMFTICLTLPVEEVIVRKLHYDIWCTYLDLKYNSLGMKQWKPRFNL